MLIVLYVRVAWVKIPSLLNAFSITGTQAKLLYNIDDKINIYEYIFEKIYVFVYITFNLKAKNNSGMPFGGRWHFGKQNQKPKTHTVTFKHFF